MAHKKVTSRKVTPKKDPRIIATISEEERIDYIRRRSLFEQKQFETMAAASYMDLLGEEFITKYGLPTAYHLDLETGDVRELEIEVVDTKES